MVPVLAAGFGPSAGKLIPEGPDVCHSKEEILPVNCCRKEDPF